MVNELFRQLVVRTIKELMFNNELTYRKSLNENFDYKQLMMSHVNRDRIIQSVQNMFSMSFQFGQQFENYSYLSFQDGLKRLYSDYNSFHTNEANNER